jgi:hypothetical protein
MAKARELLDRPEELRVHREREACLSVEPVA